jgi:hypothetical protein
MHAPLPVLLERANDVQKVCVVALFCRWNAKVFEAFVGIVQGIEARAPAFVGERWICHYKVESLERSAVLELGCRERIALHDERFGVIVQDHVHPRETASRGVHFLPIDRGVGLGFVRNL